MEASSSSLLRAPPLLGPACRKAHARPRRIHVAVPGGFEDAGHLKYYAAPVRCSPRAVEACGGRRRAKLADALTRDLTALMGVGFGLEEKDDDEKMLSEAAGVLLAQLEKVRVKDKCLKEKKRKKGKSMKKSKKMDCDDSSSSSSESSDTECDERVVDMSALRTAPPVDTTLCNQLTKEGDCTKKMRMKDCNDSSSSSSESSDSDCEGEIVEASAFRAVLTSNAMPALPKLQVEGPKMIQDTSNTVSVVTRPPSPSQEFTTSSIMTTASCTKDSILPLPPPLSTVAVSADRIEVCMGGKCKKSGAMQLMEEFEKCVGAAGAVVGCKCMGKCKEGPNVRIRSPRKEDEEVSGSNRPGNPICIGVGLEDVSAIVSNYLGEGSLGIQTCGA